jgi:TM2 domain-containing membrane protein YozV
MAEQIPGADKKITAGVCAILLGAFGVHKFILGYQKAGVIMLVISLIGLILCGIPSSIMGIIGIVEGIIYLTKSDEEFVATYINGKKEWF